MNIPPEITVIENPVYVSSFPWRRYPMSELLLEYEKLRTKKNCRILVPMKFSQIGYKCTNQYFQYERMSTPCIRRDSATVYWVKNKDYITNYDHKTKGDYFRLVNFLSRAPSQFPLFTALQLYKYFKATKILDPYAGWGDRCLAAMAMDIDYTGIDKNTNLADAYTRIQQVFPTKSTVSMYFQSAETFDYNSVQFDMVLTSPPFWRNKSLIEKYNQTDHDYDTFMKTSLVPVLIACIAKCTRVGTTCVYIPPSMYKDLKKYIGKCKQKIPCYFPGNTVNDIYCW